jgi:general secretion pathway protein A
MYKTFFGLKREPFSVAADPRFIYMSPQHRQAAQHLLYGLHSGAGFILLTGEIGAGKTVVCRAFLRLLPANTDVANVVNPRMDFQGLLMRVCEDLRVEVSANNPDLIDAIHGHLLLAHAQGRRTLIVVDEAQALSHEVLELLRLLTNLDSTGRKLQIFLIGQPELRTTLRLPALQPVSQRIVARYHLRALPEPETARYIAHRLNKAGLVGALPFDDAALKAVHEACGGVPRRINVLCDRAMLAARQRKTKHIGAALIEEITSSVFDLPRRATQTSEPLGIALAAAPLGSPEFKPQRRWQLAAACAAVFACTALGAVILGLLHPHILAAPAAISPPHASSTPAAALAPAANSLPPATSSSGPAADSPRPSVPDPPDLASTASALARSDTVTQPPLER